MKLSRYDCCSIIWGNAIMEQRIYKNRIVICLFFLNLLELIGWRRFLIGQRAGISKALPNSNASQTQYGNVREAMCLAMQDMAGYTPLLTGKHLKIRQAASIIEDEVTDRNLKVSLMPFKVTFIQPGSYVLNYNYQTHWHGKKERGGIKS